MYINTAIPETNTATSIVLHVHTACARACVCVCVRVHNASQWPDATYRNRMHSLCNEAQGNTPSCAVMHFNDLNEVHKLRKCRCVYLHLCLCTHLPVCARGWQSVCMLVFRTGVRIYVCTRCVCIYVCVGVYRCRCMCLCMSIYVCVYACVRARVFRNINNLSIATPRQPEAHQSAQASTLEHFCVLQPRWIMQVCGSCFIMLEGQILSGFHDNRGKRTCQKATVVCIEHPHSVF